MIKHEIGHLPFEADITEHLRYGGENRITVLCDNSLVANSVPQGKILEVPRYVNFRNATFSKLQPFNCIIFI